MQARRACASRHRGKVFLFILESIGTSELILIGVIALIFLGPRKLPGIARTIGKYMAEFRKTTSEFKSTWEKEVDFAMEEETTKKEAAELSQQQVARIEEKTIDIPAVEMKLQRSNRSTNRRLPA